MITLFALVQLAQLAQFATGSTDPVRFELPNGLRVWVQEDHARPVALVQITYKAGSLHEGPGTTGIAHYVEHMVYRATQNIRNEDIYGYIDRIGGRYTGGTWPEFTRYGETVPSWALESALRVTAERMCCALFDSLEFERERSNVVTEANGFSDVDPVNAFRDAVLSASFELHPYRYNSNTWVRDNLVLTREEAFAWYRRYYGPNNAVLVVVGDVDVGEVRRLVEKHFAGIPRAPQSGEIRLVEPPQRVEKRVMLTSPGVAGQMEIVYRAPQASHPDFPALRVLNRVLAPRLDGIATARITTSDSATQYPYVYRISVTADSSADLHKILNAVQGEIEKLGRGVVTAEDVAAAVRDPAMQPTGDTVRGSQQSSGIPPRRNYLNRIAERLTEREALSWEVSDALRERIRVATTKVTAQEVQSYANRWLRSSQRTVGMLTPGRDDFVPQWSDGRRVVGHRLDIPPLTTPPAKRMRPEPVPQRALRPLEPLPIETARRVLENGIVLRAARLDGPTTAIHVRADSGAASDIGGFVEIRSTVPATRAGSAADSLARTVVDRKLYEGGPLTVSIVGPSAPNALLTIVARAFAPLPPLRQWSPAPQARTGTGRGVEERFVEGKTQVSIDARLPGVPRGHPDRRALELLNYIVGVPSYGGRLGWALTKVGLTYSSAARATFAARGGHISFTTVCDTRNTPATVQAIREVIAGVGANGVEEWELKEAQAFTLGRTLLYGARQDSGVDALATALVDSEFAGVELLDLQAFSRAYLSVTLDEINRVAREYYRPELLRITATGAVPRGEDRQIFPDGTFRSLFEP